jgi:hypothetical protein
MIKEQHRKLKGEAGKYLYSTFEPSLSIKVNDNFITIKVSGNSFSTCFLMFEDGMLSITSQRTWLIRTSFEIASVTF